MSAPCRHAAARAAAAGGRRGPRARTPGSAGRGPRLARAADAAGAGFVLLAVLLLAALVVTGVAAYSRHALLADKHALASQRQQTSSEAALSAIACARQSLAAGLELPSEPFLAGDGLVALTALDAGDGVHLVRADATDRGFGTIVLAEIRTRPLPASPGAQLPALAQTIVADVRTDPNTTVLVDGTALTDVVLSGTIVLAKGATVTLDDVVVYGSIVSAAALDGPPYEDGDAAALRTAAGLRVEPSDELLAGLAIFIPDGSFTAAATSSIEIDGAVVAGVVTAAGRGAITGNVAAQQLVLSDDVDRPGDGRTPRDWPAVLLHTHLATSTVAFVTPPVTSDEKRAIATSDF